MYVSNDVLRGPGALGNYWSMLSQSQPGRAYDFNFSGSAVHPLDDYVRWFALPVRDTGNDCIFLNRQNLVFGRLGNYHVV